MGTDKISERRCRITHYVDSPAIILLMQSYDNTEFLLEHIFYTLQIFLLVTMRMDYIGLVADGLERSIIHEPYCQRSRVKHFGDQFRDHFLSPNVELLGVKTK